MHFNRILKINRRDMNDKIETWEQSATVIDAYCTKHNIASDEEFFAFRFKKD